MPQPAPIMPASLSIIKIPAADWQKVTGPADIASHGFRARSSCRLPDPIGQRRGAACLGGKATLTAAETQQPMRTQPTAWARERGEPSYASPARALRSCAVRREGPSNLRYDLTTASKKQGQTHCQLCMLRQSCPTHARLLCALPCFDRLVPYRTGQAGGLERMPSSVVVVRHETPVACCKISV